MSTLDKATVADIRAKVNDALSGIQVPHPQQKKLDDLWDELAGPDKNAPAPPSASAKK